VAIFPNNRVGRPEVVIGAGLQAKTRADCRFRLLTAEAAELHHISRFLSPFACFPGNNFSQGLQNEQNGDYWLKYYQGTREREQKPGNYGWSLPAGLLAVQQSETTICSLFWLANPAPNKQLSGSTYTVVRKYCHSANNPELFQECEQDSGCERDSRHFLRFSGASSIAFRSQELKADVRQLSVRAEIRARSFSKRGLEHRVFEHRQGPPSLQTVNARCTKIKDGPGKLPALWFVHL